MFDESVEKVTGVLGQSNKATGVYSETYTLNVNNDCLAAGSFIQIDASISISSSIWYSIVS